MKYQRSNSLLRFTLMLVMGLSCSALLAAPPGPPTVDVNVTNDETSPVPVTIQNGGATIVEYRYIGVTTATTDGSAEATTPQSATLRGVAALHRMCAIEYGGQHPGARAATLSESRFATDPLPHEAAWVVASGVDVAENVALGARAYDIATGKGVGSTEAAASTAAGVSQCFGFVNALSQFSGPVVDTNGTYQLRTCDVARPVACAAPIAFTVAQ